MGSFDPPAETISKNTAKYPFHCFITLIIVFYFVFICCYRIIFRELDLYSLNSRHLAQNQSFVLPISMIKNICKESPNFRRGFFSVIFYLSLPKLPLFPKKKSLYVNTYMSSRKYQT